MDGVVDAAPQLGAWASIRGFFTPATLFLVVNLVIGTIALTSRATQQRRRRQQYYQYYHDDGHLHDPHMQPPSQHQQEYHHQHHYYPQEQAPYAPPPPAPLARTSSVLDRLRSFGLYRFRSGDFPPEYGAAGPPNHAQDAFAPVVESEQAHYARSRSEPAPPLPAREEERRPAARASKAGSEVRRSQAARAPAARVVEAAVAENDYVGASRAEETVVGGFRREPSPLQQEYHQYQEEEYVPPVRAPAPAPLQRTSSVLDRLRSIGLYGFLAPEQPAAASIPERDGLAAATLAVAGEKQHAHYDRSRSEPALEQQGKKEKKQEAKPRMAKSSSAARKAAAPSPAAAGEGVDARAEAFIDSFRQQQQVRHHQAEQEEYVPPPAPAPLPRTSSVLDRLRSFGLYRFRSGDLGPDLPAATAAAETPAPAAEEKKSHEAHYGRSRSEPAREQGKREPRMSRSSSSVVEEEEHEADHGVDARADDFINKFRQQLQLQRLNSLLNYKEMLGRGGKQ